MSLTREEWEELWRSTRKVRKAVNMVLANTQSPRNRVQLRQIEIEVELWREKIQQVIGQME